MTHDTVERGWYLQLLKVKLGRLRLQNGCHDFDGRVTGKWTLAGEHLVEHRTKAEDVGTMVHRLATYLLRRHVRCRTHHHTGLRLHRLHCLHCEIRHVPGRLCRRHD